MLKHTVLTDDDRAPAGTWELLRQAEIGRDRRPDFPGLCLVTVMTTLLDREARHCLDVISSVLVREDVDG